MTILSPSLNLILMKEGNTETITIKVNEKEVSVPPGLPFFN